MRRLLFLLAALSFGCEPWESPIRIRGKVLGFDGQPLPYPALSLYMNTWYRKDVALGAQDGTYSLEYKPTDLMATGEHQYQHYELFVTAATGESAHASFGLEESSNVELPTMQLWDAKLQVNDLGDRFDVSYSPLQELSSYEAVVRIPMSSFERYYNDIWRQALSGPSVAMPREITEDLTHSYLSIEAAADGYSVASRRVQISAGAPPVSRSNACILAGVTHAAGKCAVTDGRLPPFGVAVPSRPEVHLSSAIRIRRVLVRSDVRAPMTLALEGKDETGAWRPLSSTQTPSGFDVLDVAPEAPPFVAIRVVEPSSEQRYGEISVYSY
jgi:hypothetical protein